MAHRAPETHRQRRLDDGVVHPHCREFIRLVEGAFSRGLVDAHAGHMTQRAGGLPHQRLPLGQQRHAGHAGGVAGHDLRHDGLPGGMVVPGNELARRIEPGLEARHRSGAVEVVPHVFFTRPDRLHRPARRGLRNDHGLGDEIDIQPAPETAAQVLHLHVHLLCVQRQQAGGHGACDVGHLGGRPDRGGVVFHEHGAVDGLHGRMRQVGRAVLGGERPGADRLGHISQRCIRVATAEVGEAFVAVQRGCKFSHQRRAGDRGRRAGVPFDHHRLGGLHRLPGLVGDHGHAAGAAGHLRLEGQHLAHPGHRGCRSAVVRGHAAAERGAHLHAGVEHAGLQHVDAEAGRAVDLASRFQARQRLSDELESGRILEQGLARNGLRRGGSRHFTETRRLARRMRQHALVHLHLGHRHGPLRGRRRHQHRARRRAGLAHRQPQVLDARRAAGHHQTDLAHRLARQPFQTAAQGAFFVGVEGQCVDDAGDVVVDAVHGRRLDAHAGPVGVQLFGQQHRQAGVHALAHFALGHDDNHAVVLTHLDPAVECDLAGRGGQRVARIQALSQWHQAEADGQRAAGGNGAQHDVAAFHAAAMRQDWPG